MKGPLDNSIFHSLPFDIDKKHRRRIPSLNKGFKFKPLNSQFDSKDVRFDNSDMITQIFVIDDT